MLTFAKLIVHFKTNNVAFNFLHFVNEALLFYTLKCFKMFLNAIDEPFCSINNLLPLKNHTVSKVLDIIKK